MTLPRTSTARSKSRQLRRPERKYLGTILGAAGRTAVANNHFANERKLTITPYKKTLKGRNEKDRETALIRETETGPLASTERAWSTINYLRVSNSWAPPPG